MHGAWLRATIRQLLADEEQTPDLLSAILEVTDADGEIVLEFPFTEALDILDEPPSRH